jgi:hypothetical protein
LLASFVRLQRAVGERRAVLRAITNAPASDNPDTVCPVCGAALISEKCKVVCRSATCGYRIVFNCSEF